MLSPFINLKLDTMTVSNVLKMTPGRRPWTTYNLLNLMSTNAASSAKAVQNRNQVSKRTSKSMGDVVTDLLNFRYPWIACETLVFLHILTLVKRL